MRRRTAETCIISGKEKVAALKRLDERSNKIRLGIAKDCRDYCRAVGKDCYKNHEIFANLIGINVNTLKDYLGQLEVSIALNDENVTPKKARKIFNRISNKKDHREIKAAAAVIEASDPIALKLETILEYIKTVERMADKLECRRADHSTWLLVTKIAGSIREKIFAKIQATKKT